MCDVIRCAQNARLFLVSFSPKFCLRSRDKPLSLFVMMSEAFLPTFYPQEERKKKGGSPPLKP